MARINSSALRSRSFSCVAPRPLIVCLLISAAFLCSIKTSVCQQQADLTSALTPHRPEEWVRLQRCRLGDDDHGHQSGLLHNSDNASELAAADVWQPHEVGGDFTKKIVWYKRLWFKIMDTCNREPNYWRVVYADEFMGRFKPLVLDRTMDERFANMIYSVSMNGLADLSFFTFNSGDARQDQLNEIRIAGPEVNEMMCERDLQEMVNQLDELSERVGALRKMDAAAEPLDEYNLRMARVLDSYGRYESASLTAHNRLVGGYEMCMAASLKRRFSVANNMIPSEIPMRYCWAKLSLREHLNKLLKRRPRLEHETSEVALASAACLPRSCHTKTLHKHKHLIKRLVDSQLVFPPGIYVNQTLELDSVFCLVDADSSFGMPLSGKLCLLFAASWLLICLGVTHLHIGDPHEATLKTICSKELQLKGGEKPQLIKASRLRRALRHFNLRKSWRDFTSDKRPASPTSRVELDVLNPIKVVASIVCVAGHAGLMHGTNSSRNGQTAGMIEGDFIIKAAFFSTVIIDSFFAMSGLLLTFIALKKLSSGFGFGNLNAVNSFDGDSRTSDSTKTSGKILCSPSPSSKTALLHRPMDIVNFLANWLAITANRYLRLVPLYALMFWFRRDVLAYLGSGPLWDYGFNKETMNGACAQESWLTPFSFLSALTPLNKQCFVPSWSISNDIFFSFTLPPLILMLQRRPKFTLYTLAALTAVTVFNTAHAYLNTVAAIRWELGEFRLYGLLMFFTALSNLYANPLYRASGYLVGAAAGYLLFHYEQGTLATATKEGQWPRWLRVHGTRISVAYMIGHVLFSFYAMEVKAAVYPFMRLIVFLFVTLDRPLWSACCAILFLRMMTDWRLSPRMQSWASQMWRTLARLNYALLFTHWIFIIVQGNLLTQMLDFTHWQLFASFTAIYTLALPAAACLHVVFENPMDNLIKRELFGL